MKNRFTLFRALQAKTDPEWLGVQLIELRLTQQRRLIASSKSATDWLEVATQTWRLRRDDDPHALQTPADMPTIEDYPQYPKRLSPTECTRIMAWAKCRIDRIVGALTPLPSKLTTEDREKLTAAARDMHVIHMTEHEIDVAFAGVHEEFPWLGRLTEHAWRQALHRARSCLPIGVGKLLLSGPPGLGKSAWARAVAQALTVPSVEVDVGATGGMFELQGISQGWGSAAKGRVISTLLTERIGNPMVILDEIDAGNRSTSSTRGSLPGLHKIMMGMIEPSTAKAWVCPYYQIPVDLRHLSWICTTNTIAHIEQALLERLVVIDLPDLTREQLMAFARRQAEKRFDGEVVEIVMQQVETAIQRGYRMSLRHTLRLLDRVEDAIARPVLH